MLRSPLGLNFSLNYEQLRTSTYNLQCKNFIEVFGVQTNAL